MGELVLYVLPMILGRTFDMDKLSVGVDIFSSNHISNPVVIENPLSDTRYSMVDSTKEIRDLLDVSGSFSLKVKAGIFKAGASGAYLSDVYNKENTVEVLVKATYETVTEMLPQDVSPVPGWSLQGALGTHYVNSITYGGELLASVRLICNNTQDKKHIKAALQLGGRIKIFDVGIEAEGEYLADVANSVDDMQIKVFSSVPLSRIPHSMDELKKVLDNFPQDLKKYNQGKGVPIKAQLWPLHFLNSTKAQYVKNSALEAQLENFELKLDDLVNTKTALFDWMKSSDKILTDEQEKKVGSLYNEVQITLRTFYSVVGILDTSQSLNQLKPAEEVYGNKLPGSFYKKYLSLRKVVMDDQGTWTAERGDGTSYIHWGQPNCTSGADTLHSGYTVGSKHSAGGFNYLCLTKVQKNLMSTETNTAILQNVTRNIPNKKVGLIPCSSCHLRKRGSVQVFSGVQSCPKGWDVQYRGILMSGNHTAYICVDQESSSQESQTTEVQLLHLSVITAASDMSKFRDLPCVVCAK